MCIKIIPFITWYEWNDFNTCRDKHDYTHFENNDLVYKMIVYIPKLSILLEPP